MANVIRCQGVNLLIVFAARLFCSPLKCKLNFVFSYYSHALLLFSPYLCYVRLNRVFVDVLWALEADRFSISVRHDIFCGRLKAVHLYHRSVVRSAICNYWVRCWCFDSLYHVRMIIVSKFVILSKLCSPLVILGVLFLRRQ